MSKHTSPAVDASSAGSVQNDFSKGSVGAAVFRMAVPITLAQLVNVAYNLVDRMYIGRIPGAGALALTGLGLCLPVISLVTAFSRLCGAGGAPLCSIERGRGDLDQAERIMGNSFALLLIFGAALTLLGELFLSPILYAFGASAETFPYARDYARIYLLGTIPVLISLGMNNFINAQGFSKMGMLTVILGAVINIVLDPVLIFLLDMGVAGAAIATVIAQTCSAVWVLVFLTGRRAILKLHLRQLILRLAIVRRVLGLGLATFIFSVTNSLVAVVANRMLLSWGGDVYVGVMTVVNSIREVIMLPASGITSGSEPVMGFNYGAGRYDRVRRCIVVTNLSALVYNLLAWGTLLLLPGLLIRVFTSDAAILAAGVPALRTYYLCYFMMTLQLAGQSTFVALGKSRQAVIFSLLRKVILVTPLMLVLPGLGLGVMGVFWAEPIAEILGGTACFVTMILTVWRPLKRIEQEETAP